MQPPARSLPVPARRHVRLFQVHQFLDRFAAGLTVAATVLALQGRGLDVGEVGALFAIYAAVAMAAELPFGGLADGIGRKPVFLSAVAASLAASLVFLASGTFWPLAASFALVGLGRALRSGTLDAWYVEGLRAHAPGAALQPLLARAQTAAFAGLGSGAIAGGLLPGLLPGNAPGAPIVGRTIYDVSYAAGMAVSAGVLAYTVLLVREPPRERNGRAVLRVARAVPATIRDGARLAVSDPALRLLLAALALMLFATNPVEVLWPTVVQAMLEPERAAAAVGLLAAAYFLAIALGAHVAARIGARLEGRDAWMLGAVLAGLALCQIALAWQGTAWGFVGAFLAFSLMLGLSESPAASVLHAHAPDDRRSTLLSLQSLVKQMGAMIGLLVLGGIGDRAGVPAAWGAGAGALAAASLLAFGLAARPGR
ncbi:MFS transporter [Jannaschia sp. Os4]|uniref:MFS transporter n=1 Tax=Jannaschia sp. Os4 TaxID=2807617 RepID=UPI001939FF89|nr:MFS transporter [Jannaschia sp. Os4]MBM2575937.1 MFS transporter [Jannaschia sp. Os4]